MAGVQSAEKIFLSFKLEVATPTTAATASLPTKDNAIYHLADGLSRLGKFDFPVHLFDVTRALLRALPLSGVYGGQLGADLKMMVQNPNDAAALARLSASPFYNAHPFAPPASPPMLTASTTPKMLSRNKPVLW